jgi:hypothetical protein
MTSREWMGYAMRLIASLMGAALGAVALAGCNGFVLSGETIVSGQKWTYQSAQIVYRRQINGSPRDPQSARLRTLTIAYPHPAGKAGYARVELVEESVLPTGTSPAEADEGWMARLRRSTRNVMPGVRLADGVSGAWAIDLRISQVNLLLYHLDQQGFFGTTVPAVPETSLAATVNGVPFERPWSQVAELEALAARVRREGSLVSHGERTGDFSLATSHPSATNSPTTVAIGPPGAPAGPQADLPNAVYPTVPAAFHAPQAATPVDDNVVTPLPPVEQGW